MFSLRFSQKPHFFKQTLVFPPSDCYESKHDYCNLIKSGAPEPISAQCYVWCRNQSFDLQCISNGWFLYEMQHWIEMCYYLQQSKVKLVAPFSHYHQDWGFHLKILVWLDGWVRWCAIFLNLQIKSRFLVLWMMLWLVQIQIWHNVVFMEFSFYFWL